MTTTVAVRGLVGESTVVLALIPLLVRESGARLHYPSNGGQGLGLWQRTEYLLCDSDPKLLACSP